MSKTVFIVQCPRCQHARDVNVQKLGAAVRCISCHQMFVTQDPELESAAMDEYIGAAARYTQEGEGTSVPPRPR